MNRNYYFDYDKLLEQYLNYKGIKNDTGDADITCIEIDGYDDTNFIKLISDFNEWKTNTNNK